jgi:serine/threonine protein kinase
MQDIKNDTTQNAAGRPTQFRSAIILPDGRKPVLLGSGTITSLLGEGGMANVYEIWNSQLEMHRAVKLLHPNCSDESKQRFQTEIKITAKLHHPNIIEIHGVGEWNGLPLIEMEKIDGYTLESLVMERGALPVTICTAIGIMISRALRYAHNQVYVIYGKEYHGVIHRDLKPSNIMVCKDGSVKLMDFGIARPTDASIHTTDGSILGTMQYLSPEQLEGKEPDVRTDIYSLGTTLYETLTGVQAFAERNVSKLMMNKIKNEYRPLESYAIKIPARLRRLIHKCMVHDREKRISSAEILLNELEKLHNHLTLDTPEQIIKQLVNSAQSERIVVATRRQFPWRTVGIGAAIALIAGSITTSIVKLRQRQHRMALQKERIARISQPVPPPVAVAPKEEAKVAPEQAAAPKPAAKKKRAAAKKKAHAPKPPKEKSFIDKMVERHGTSDLLEIMVSEVNHGNYLNASLVFKSLSAEQAAEPKAVIYQMRTLSALGKTSDLRRYLSSQSVDDAEYYLEKAKLAYSRKNISQAQQLLDRAIRSPRQFIDSNKLRNDIYYYKALCATAAFDAAPSEATYKSALDAWWQVRNELRTSPTHKYNKKAASETQRIGEKYHNIKG